MSQREEYPSLDTAPAGSIRFNTDSAKMEIYNGEQWWNIDSTSPEEQTGGTRGLFYGGNTPSNRDTIEFIQINTTGDTVDFGNLISAQQEAGGGSADRTRGIISGGFTNPTHTDTIQFVTIASPGNATDFGNLTVSRGYVASINNGTRSVTGGAFTPLTNTLDYVTIQATGNSVDFGDLTLARQMDASCESPTRGIFMGGINGGSPYVDYDTIDFITTSTLGNATDFGNLTQAKFSGGGCGNAIRGLHGGGNNLPSNLTEIEFITMASLGNAVDFGDLTTAGYYTAACSSPTRGVWGGGAAPSRHNVVQYVQFASAGNALDFGNLLNTTYELGALSNGNGGLG